ncbi:MAG TPA: hypothetical protein VJI13_05315 [Candidatus Norongarragalinales archaeon]|nr:hypothetical protein [Candidatus Norongarragalinales archaeon]
MVEKDVYIRELNCEACERLVERIAIRHSVKLEDVDFQQKRARLSGETPQMEAMAQELEKMGYSTSFERVPRGGKGKMRLINFIRGAIFGEDNYKVEAKGVEIFVFSFVILAVATISMSFVGIITGDSTYYAFLSLISIAVIIAVAWQVEAYRDSFTHMNGMMIGMTIGMTAGFLAGAIVGATNGMFIGTVYGMLIGMAAGAYLGYCCGIMGVLEGLMGGLMAGTMGAMLSVMMIFDNLKLFLPILLASFVIIMFGLSYMIHKENIGFKAEKPKIWGFLALALLVHIITLLVIAYGPKSAAVLAG